MVAGHAEIPMKVVMIIFITLLRGDCALECRDGQYLSGDVCRGCKSTCTKCISEFLCTECEIGFFGEACTKTCSLGCFEKRCVKKTGNCNSCDKGYYVKNVMCEECPEKCTECLNADKCTSCMTGYTGSICENLCVNCKPDSGCSLDDGMCTDGCKDGYSGLSCLERCSSNCLSCNRVDAKSCNACVKGKYGSNCEKPCPTKCVDNICSKETGACTHGCQNGSWGDQCEYVCPVNCRGGTCLRSSGVCSDGCRGHFTGTKCLCPRTCNCNEDGACIKCDKNTGYVCDKQCSSMCMNNLCSSGTERKCLYGCRDGHDDSLCSSLLTDLETDDGKSYVTIIVILVVVAGILVFVFCVTVFIKRRKAWLSGMMRLATTQSYAEGCSRVASEMCNLRYPVSSDENEPPSNIRKQYEDQYEIMQNSENTFLESCLKNIQDDHINAGHETEESQFQEENGLEYASLLETCHEPSKVKDQQMGARSQIPAFLKCHAGDLVQETGPRANTPSGQCRPTSPKARSQRAEGATDLTEEPSNQKKKYQVSLSTKVPLRKLENLTEDDILNEFKRLSASTERKEVDETNPYELLKSSSLAKDYQDSLNACYIDSEQHWPNLGDSFKCGDITVKCRSLDDFEDDFIQRELVIKKETEERIILQQHFVAWPEDLVPRSVSSLTEFQKYRYSSTSEKVVPVVVHCSDGIGRTGTYIAFDSLVQEGRAIGSVDVLSCVQRLREQKSIKQKLGQQRKTMLQTYEQYSFLYKALQSWFKQDQQKNTMRQVVPRQTVDSSFEPVEPQSDNPYKFFSLMHALDIQTD